MDEKSSNNAKNDITSHHSIENLQLRKESTTLKDQYVTLMKLTNMDIESIPVPTEESFVIEKPDSCESLSLVDLINAYDNFKVVARKELSSLKEETSSIEMQAKDVKQKIKIANQLVKASKLGESVCNSLSATYLQSNPIPVNDRRVLACLARKIKKLITDSSMAFYKIEHLGRIIEKIGIVDPETTEEINNMEWQVIMMQGAQKQLQFSLDSTKNEVMRLSEENAQLKTEMANVEEQYFNYKLELDAIKRANSSSTDPLMAMERDLTQIKNAFYQNEEIIKAKNLKLSKKDNLIKQYEEYCRTAKVLLDERETLENELFSRREEWDNEKRHIISEKKKAEKINDHLQKRLIFVEEENAQLKYSMSFYMAEVERVEKMHAAMLKEFPSKTLGLQKSIPISYASKTNCKNAQNFPLNSGGSGDSSYRQSHADQREI